MPYQYKVTAEELELIWDCVDSLTTESGDQLRISEEFPKQLNFVITDSNAYTHWEAPRYLGNSDESFFVVLKDFSSQIRRLQRLQRIIDQFEETHVAIKV